MEMAVSPPKLTTPPLITNKKGEGEEEKGEKKERREEKREREREKP